MKKVFAIAVFLAVWFVAANYLLDLTWWQSFLYRPIIVCISYVLGMSVGASIAIVVLNVLDWLFDPEGEQAVTNATTYAR